MKIEENIPLAELTTFKIGGAARYFARVSNTSDLSIALDYAQTRNIPYVILAGGSNTLIADNGFAGLVVSMEMKKLSFDRATGLLSAEAGCNLQGTIDAALEAELGGMESMYGIPGTVGGAVRGNAGAFGTEITDIVTEVEALNKETREVKTFTHDECLFGYRNSFFKKNDDWVILRASLQLTPGDAQELRAAADETLALRNERQIQNIQSAGSFFMNPTVHEGIQEQFFAEKGVVAKERRVPAGWLIEKSGFKGECRDAVCTGSRSANYLINTGVATAMSVVEFAREIKMKVLQDFGVELHEEVTLVGF